MYVDPGLMVSMCLSIIMVNLYGKEDKAMYSKCCTTCEHLNVPWESMPCRGCHCKSAYQAVSPAKKDQEMSRSCMTCKHACLSKYAWPCKSCNDKDKWEA